MSIKPGNIDEYIYARLSRTFSLYKWMNKCKHVPVHVICFQIAWVLMLVIFYWVMLLFWVSWSRYHHTQENYMITPILHMGELRLRRVQSFGWGGRAGSEPSGPKRQSSPPAPWLCMFASYCKAAWWLHNLTQASFSGCVVRGHACHCNWTSCPRPLICSAACGSSLDAEA